jgi:hypothetical protein
MGGCDSVEGIRAAEEKTMPAIPFDYHAFDYDVFAQALLSWLELQGEARVLPYAIEINPHGHLDGPIVVWLLAHAPPEAVAAAEQQARRTPRSED